MSSWPSPEAVARLRRNVIISDVKYYAEKMAKPYTTTRYGNHPVASPLGRAYWRGWDYRKSGIFPGTETSPERRSAFWAGYDMAKASEPHP